MTVSVAGVAYGDTQVVIVGLTFQGEVSAVARKVMAERLVNGLLAAGLNVAPEESRRRALAKRAGACGEPACWKGVAAELGCRYAVGGTIKAEDQDYEITLWMGDAATGAVAARVAERCDPCGLRAASEKMDLTASALAAKLAATAAAPARVTLISEPAAATVVLDGKEIGTAPREIELAAGKHEIVVRASGFLAATRKITVLAGVSERIEIRLLPQPARGRASATRIAGWVTLGAGLAAIGAGIALFAIDGQEVDCAVAPAGRGCHRRATMTEAAILTAVGVAAGGVGGYLLYRSRADERRTERRAALVPTASGAGLTVSF